MAAVLAAALGLAGCSDGRHTPLPAAVAALADPASREVAVARGTVEVQGGLVALSPAAEGTVEQVAVREGDTVRRGQLLLRLSSAGPQADVAVAEAESRLAAARRQARAQRLPALQAAAARLREAAAAGAADAQRSDESAQALRDAQSELAVADAEAAVARSTLAQARAQLARFALHAPEDGTVVRVQAQPGTHTTPTGGTAALVLLPKRPLVVRAELNETYADAVRPGMRATVVPDGDAPAGAALPTARVVRISPLYGAARLLDDAQRGPQRVIECVLEFDPSQGRNALTARPGQNVRVSFLHD
ncbi:efflux RND transporter periplasmic adaptor subunit [Xylophilus sp.]|uniref:efflux RND transporter periplasmic adaptor subunit n=1 Tax=Xylophilus sp. TaxID=2653893 RepID=UPI002D801B84|nr:efflux RND transporter periplasmic adaptor subunit [Xylophilus sp.]